MCHRWIGLVPDPRHARKDLTPTRLSYGIATLYRHFPTREALVEAVHHNEVDQLCASAGELLAQLPADAALEEGMERFVAYAATKRGLSDALKYVASAKPDLFGATRERLLTAIGALLGAGSAAARVRTARAAPADGRATRRRIEGSGGQLGLVGERRPAGACAL